MEKRTPKQEINASLNAPKLGIIWKAYLVVYNLAMFMGWCYVLYITILNFHFEDIGTTYLYWIVQLPLRVVISFAVLENIHVYAGIGNDLDQKGVARLQTLFQSLMALMFDISSTVSSSPGVPIVLFAWILTEIIRYGYCFFNIIAHYRLLTGFRWMLKLTGIIGAFGVHFCLYKHIGFSNEGNLAALSVYQGQLVVFYAQFRYAYCLQSWPRNVIEEEETKHDTENIECFGFFSVFALFVNFCILGYVLASTYPSIVEHL